MSKNVISYKEKKTLKDSNIKCPVECPVCEGWILDKEKVKWLIAIKKVLEDRKACLNLLNSRGY